MIRKCMIFLMFVVFLNSCKEGYQRKNSHRKSFIENKCILNDNFALELKRWAEDVESNIDTTWNSANCYTIGFFHGKWRDVELGNDTLVIISYYSEPSDTLGYKGVLTFEDYKVAIFDKDNIGEFYYDTSVLENVPLGNFKRGKLLYDKLIINLFILNHGQLKKKVRL